VSNDAEKAQRIMTVPLLKNNTSIKTYFEFIAQLHKTASCYYEIKVNLPLGLNNYAQHRKDIWDSQVIAPSLLTFALNGQLHSRG
jgi:hypothetical protein